MALGVGKGFGFWGVQALGSSTLKAVNLVRHGGELQHRKSYPEIRQRRGLNMKNRVWGSCTSSY